MENRSASILLVEKEQRSRNIVDNFLQHDGHRVLYATSCDEALQILEFNPVDMILLDSEMEDGCAYDLCGKIRATEFIGEVPIIMLVSRDEHDARNRGMETGADDFLVKPVDGPELRSRVRTISRLNHYRELYEAQKYLADQTAELNKLRNFDPLTGLPNRLRFDHLLAKEITRGKASGYSIAVMAIGIREVGEVLGVYSKEDTQNLTAEIAHRLKSATKGRGTVGQIDSGTFVVFQPIPRKDDLVPAILQSRDCFAQSFILNNEHVRMSCSIGASVFPSDSKKTETLLSLAISAKSQAEAMGRNRYHIYAPGGRRQAKDRLRMLTDVAQKIENRDFELYYQPRVRMHDKHVTSIEALMRMRADDGSLIPPGEFFPVAKDMGVMHEVGLWALTKACEDIHKIRAMGYPDVRIALNFSATELRHPAFLESYTNILEEFGVDGNSLELELKECALSPDREFDLHHLRATLNNFRKSGALISIDNFGAGSSSLSLLRYLPIDIIKIDQSFIKDIPDDRMASSIAQSVIRFCQELHLKVVAQGVENERQIRFLQSQNCEEAQGFWYARPAPLENFSSGMLKSSRAVGVEENAEDESRDVAHLH